MTWLKYRIKENTNELRKLAHFRLTTLSITSCLGSFKVTSCRKGKKKKDEMKHEIESILCIFNEQRKRMVMIELWENIDYIT